MNISSLVLHVRLDRADSLRQRLQGLAGAEVHAASAAGKLIVTIETAGDADTMAMFETISQMNEVLSAAMVYHQTESDPDKELSYETDAA